MLPPPPDSDLKPSGKMTDREFWSQFPPEVELAYVAGRNKGAYRPPEPKPKPVIRVPAIFWFLSGAIACYLALEFLP